MQRVVRSTLVGLLTIAGLTACGDKVNVVQPVTPVGVVHSVTVSPSTLPLSVGGTGTLSASVDADASLTGKGVTWTSTDATIASVSTAGLVTGIKVGTTTIIATSVADPTQKGSAVVTVSTSTTTPAVFSVSTVNTGNVPANLSAVAGQLDVTFNVDGTGSSAPARIDLILTCPATGPRIVATQNIASTGNVATVSTAGEAASPITLSFNTAQLDSTINPVFINAACTIGGRLTTVGGTVINSSNAIALTLANVSVFTASTSFAQTSPADAPTRAPSKISDLDGLLYNQGSLTVTIKPINFNSAVALQTISVSLSDIGAGGGIVATHTAGNLTAAAGTQTFTFTFPATATCAGGSCIYQVTSPSPNGSRINVTASTDVNGNPGFTTTQITGGGGGTPVVGGAVVPPTVTNGIAFLPGLAAAQVTRFDNTSPLAGPATTSFNVTAITSSNVFPGAPAPASNTAWISGSTTGATLSGSPFLFTSGTGATTTYHIQSAGLVTGSDDRFVGTTVVFGFQANTTGLASGAVNSTSPTTCVQTNWTPITTAALAALAQTPLNVATPTTYRLRSFEYDALGNVHCVDLPNPFGVDNGAPSIFATPLANGGNVQTLTGNNTVLANIASGQVSSAASSIAFSFADSLSGFINGKELNGNVLFDFLPTTGNCVIGVATATTCGFTQITAANQTIGNIASETFDIRAGNVTDGYYTATVRSVDQAGNLSSTITRTYLFDITAPTIGGIGFGATLSGAVGGANFTSVAADNVDLKGAAISFIYGTGTPITVADSIPGFGPTFDSTRTTSVPIAYTGGTAGFIQQIYQEAAGDAVPAAGVDATTIANTVSLRSVDAANNASPISTAAIPAGNITATAAPATTGGAFTTFTVAAPGAAVNVSNAAASVNNTTVPLAAALQGPTSQAASPFAKVCFYYQQNAAGALAYAGIAAGSYVLIPNGCIANPDVADAGAIRTWTYRMTFNPDVTLGTTGVLNIRAFGFGAANPGVVISTSANANITLVP